jgi:hypothetical protein
MHQPDACIWRFVYVMQYYCMRCPAAGAHWPCNELLHPLHMTPDILL